MADAYEPWVGSETFIDGTYEGSSWDQVSLGAYFLPGVCTIEGLEVGIDCDVQKRKKREKAVVKDLGMKPNRFRIITEIRAAQWRDWLKVLPIILPREGKTRQPFAIVHPLVNANGINTIYIESIACDSPSARKGMRITIKVVEWLPEAKEKDTKPTKKKPDARPPRKPNEKATNYTSQRIDKLDQIGNYPAVDEKAMIKNLFGGG
jgi:hypothetical protein